MEAQELVDAQRLTEAVDLLHRINHERPDPERERLLLLLRNLAFEQTPPAQRTRGRDTWPPTHADPFPGERGLPEVAAEDLDVATIAGGISHHGSVLARGLFSPATVERLVDATDQALAAAQKHLDGAPVKETAPWFVPFTNVYRVFGECIEWVRAVDSPRGAFALTEAFADINDRALTDYLGERPAMAGNKWTLRRITPDCHGDWHQDGRFLGTEIRVINVWVALTRCGGDAPAPGLDVVPDRVAQIADTGTEGAVTHVSIGRPVVERLAGDAEILDPVYEAGDALIFDQFTLHRTGSKPGLTENRYAIESWFFAPSTYPTDDEVDAPTPMLF